MNTDSMNFTADVSGRALRRSQEILVLRRELNKARGYHAIFVGDTIHACEQSIVRYADIVVSQLAEGIPHATGKV